MFGNPNDNWYDIDRGYDVQVCLIVSSWSLIKLQGARMFYLPKQCIIYIYTPQFCVLPQCIAFSIHAHDGHITDHIDLSMYRRDIVQRPECLPTETDVDLANEFLRRFRDPNNILWDHKYYNDIEKSRYQSVMVNKKDGGFKQGKLT